MLLYCIYYEVHHKHCMLSIPFASHSYGDWVFFSYADGKHINT